MSNILARKRNFPMPIRTFTLDDPEAYGILCRREPTLLPRDPLWGERSDPVSVSADSESDAEQALQSWLRQLEASPPSAKVDRTKHLE